MAKNDRLAVSVKNIHKTYTSQEKTVEALTDVSFDIEQGELFGLLGPNGAGKTTLINTISGITDKTRGTASVCGYDIDTAITDVKYCIGVMPQEIAFDAFFTVETALRFQFGYYNLPVDEDYMYGLLERLALYEKRDVKPRQLSGGMKRRLMIARALIHRPDVLVLDEPTAGVDVELRHELYDLIRELHNDGTTIIFTSHYLEEVELLCDRVAILQHGKLVALDDKQTLKDRFQTNRTLSLSLAKKVDLPESLTRFSPTWSKHELRLQFEEDEYKAVLQAVAKADLPVANFHVIEPSLEDVFISLTHEE